MESTALYHQTGNGTSRSSLKKYITSGGAGFTGCGKTHGVVILSEAKNPSLFLCLPFNRREILRFAQNDKTKYFFRSLFSPRDLHH